VLVAALQRDAKAVSLDELLDDGDHDVGAAVDQRGVESLVVLEAL